jgi:FKBP-type peptidyl-prolyl cis-trans isomerase 2
MKRSGIPMTILIDCGILLMCFLLLLPGCGNQPDEPGQFPSSTTVLPGRVQTTEAREGDTVKVHYTLTLEDGTVYYSSLGDEPNEYILGQDELVPDFEKAIIGMMVGESKTITIPAERAYGSYNNELIYEMSRDNLPAGVNPEIGQRLQAIQPDGQVDIVTIIKVSDESVTVDANHPLAGKNLTLEIELLEIE